MCVFCLWPLVLARLRCVCVCVRVCLLFRLLWLPVLGSLFLSVMCVCMGFAKIKGSSLARGPRYLCKFGWGVCFQSALKAPLDPRSKRPRKLCSASWILDLGALSKRFESTAPLLGVLGIWANLVGGVCFQSALKAHPPNQICSNTKGFWVLKLGGPQHLENLL